MSFSYSVNIRKINNPKGKTMAFCQLDIEGVIQIEGFKIINGANGLFVSAPQHKGTNKDGEVTYYDDVRFPGDRPEGVFRTPIQDEIYKTMVEEYNRQEGSSSGGNSNTGGNDRGAAAAAQQQGHNLWNQVP